MKRDAQLEEAKAKLESLRQREKQAIADLTQQRAKALEENAIARVTQDTAALKASRENLTRIDMLTRTSPARYDKAIGKLEDLIAELEAEE